MLLVSGNNMLSAAQHFKKFLLHCGKKPFITLLFIGFFQHITARCLAQRRMILIPMLPRCNLFA